MNNRNPVEEMNEETKSVNLACEKYGWQFQQPYTLALKLIVTRRRRGMNETQLLFWMSQATDDQKREAREDAMAIMEACK